MKTDLSGLDPFHYPVFLKSDAMYSFGVKDLEKKKHGLMSPLITKHPLNPVLKWRMTRSCIPLFSVSKKRAFLLLLGLEKQGFLEFPLLIWLVWQELTLCFCCITPMKMPFFLASSRIFSGEAKGSLLSKKKVNQTLSFTVLLYSILTLLQSLSFLIMSAKQRSHF